MGSSEQFLRYPGTAGGRRARCWELRFATCTSRICGVHRMDGTTFSPDRASSHCLTVKQALQQLEYEGFISFEWEKKWHPSIADPEIALPHFARWFRESWAHG